MNIFSNIGITELILILLLALLVVGPERLPEMGRKLAKTLRDLRKMYENLTKDLGPELMSLQQTTQELRESVESVTSIPKDMVESVVKAADLDDTIAELKEVKGSLEGVGQTVSSAGKMIKDPVGSAVDTARKTLLPSASGESAESAEPAGAEELTDRDDVDGLHQAAEEALESIEADKAADTRESTAEPPSVKEGPAEQPDE